MKFRIAKTDGPKTLPGIGGAQVDKTIVAPVPTRPTADREGTLVDNGDGSYKYTFARDITKAKDVFAAATLTAPSVAADLGDLTYDPALTHRLVVQVSVRAAANLVYDFIPATGKAVAVPIRSASRVIAHPVRSP